MKEIPIILITAQVFKLCYSTSLLREMIVESDGFNLWNVLDTRVLKRFSYFKVLRLEGLKGQSVAVYMSVQKENGAVDHNWN